MKYAYPLNLSFKLIALAPRISVKDAQGQEIFYIEQKVFALKEAVKVFNNSKDKKLLFTIKANQIFDFGAKYMISSADGKVLGAVQQEGMRSLFRGSYLVFDTHDKPIFTITQSNPWTSLLDSVINIIPFAEFVTGFILNAAYVITNKETNEQIMQMKKRPSLFEAQFVISSKADTLEEKNELLLLLSLLMTVQLERDRG